MAICKAVEREPNIIRATVECGTFLGWVKNVSVHRKQAKEFVREEMPVGGINSPVYYWGGAPCGEDGGARGPRGRCWFGRWRRRSSRWR